MFAALLLTLHTADNEDHKWAAKQTSAAQSTTANEDIDSVSFVLPFQHSEKIQDAIGVQWPAFRAASAIAPVPQLVYAHGTPIPLTRASYAALAFVVGLYWFGIATWLDKRLVQRKRPSHLKWVRILLKVMAVPTTLLFALFLCKDLLGGWPEGPNGAYGVTAWLALASLILLTEIGHSWNHASRRAKDASSADQLARL